MKRIVLVLALVLAAPLVARADDTAEANRHFRLGVALYNEGKFGEALVEFQRAYDIAPHPAVLYNLGATCRELSRYEDAIEHFDRLLTEGPGKVKPEILDRARRELDDLRARLATVHVKTDPEGASVTVDGRDVGETPLSRPVRVGPGEHTFVLRAPSGRVETRVLTLASGDEDTLEVAFPAIQRSDGETDGTPDDAGLRARATRPGRIGVGAGFATNVLLVDETGAPVLGGSVRLGDRLSLGVDVVLIAWAVMPSVRVRVAGERLAVHLVAALPVAFTDGDASELFVAGAGGVGLRFAATPSISLRAEALGSYAGGEHGLTVPVSLGAELWF